MAKKTDQVIESAPGTALTPALTPADEANFNNKLDLARKVNSAASEMAQAQLHAMRLLGQVEAFNAVNQYAGVGFITAIKEIKESGGYKGLHVPQLNGDITICATFEEFCAALGKSRSKIDEDIQNLNVLGADLMLASDKAGLSYRQLRQLRKLPEEARLALTAGSLPDDAEELKDMIEDALSKQADAEKKIAKLEESHAARSTIIDKKNKALDKAMTELAKLKNIPPKEAARIQGEKEQAALKELHADGLELIGSLTKYLAKSMGILEDEDCSNAVQKLVHDITSGLCSTIAQSLIDAGFDIDFKQIVYPQSITAAMLNATPETPEASEA